MLDEGVPQSTLDRVAPGVKTSDVNNLFGALDRAIPGLGKVVKQNANIGVAAGINALGKEAVLEGKKARSFPLRFVDGTAFLGPLTPVAFGDYGVGSNHVLPTMRTARFASGLRAADFVTVSSVVEATGEALEGFGPDVEALARAEGLPGHAGAVEARRSVPVAPADPDPPTS